MHSEESGVSENDVEEAQSDDESNTDTKYGPVEIEI